MNKILAQNWQRVKYPLFCILFVFFSVSSYIAYKLQVNRLTEAAVQQGQLVLFDLETNSVAVGHILYDNQQKEDHVHKSAELSYRLNTIAEADLNKPKIALVITDLGLSSEITQTAIEQDKIFTLGFSPYASNIEDWIEKSFNSGFETYIQIPMQPINPAVSDSGPFSLSQDLSTAENLFRLEWVLSRSNKIAGFYTLKNEAFSTSKVQLLPVLEKLKEKEMILLYGNDANNENLRSLTEYIKLDYLPISHVIDDMLNEKAIMSKLDELLVHAISTGTAVGYLSPYPLSINTVKKWLENVDRSRFVIVPVSAVLGSLGRKNILENTDVRR